MLNQAVSMLNQTVGLFGDFMFEVNQSTSTPPSIDASDDGAATHVAGSPSDLRGLRLAAAATTPAPRTVSVAVDNSSDSETSVAASAGAIWQHATATVSAQQPLRAEKRAHDVDEEAGLGAASSKRARSNNDDSPNGLGGVKRTRISWSPEQEIALIMGASIYGATRSWAKMLRDPWLRPALTQDGSARTNKDLKNKFRNLVLKHGVDKLVQDGNVAWDVLFARVPSAVHGDKLPAPSDIATAAARASARVATYTITREH